MPPRQVPRLDPTEHPSALPDPNEALQQPNGLLAAGGRLTPDWLLWAYAHGIFPWYSPGEPILWWSPDPRAVFDPQRWSPRRSLRQSIRHRGYTVRIDADFGATIRACAAPREEDTGTWITAPMIEAYERLHALGYAHSVETWSEGSLVGGLYGVRLGGVFFGESMFSFARDASKVALAHLLGEACAHGIALVDCQMPTPHLESLGAERMARPTYLARLRELIGTQPAPGSPGRL